MPVMEANNFVGKTAEQLAGIFQEKGVHLSIISPRKIPALFKLFEKSGGDLTSFQTKNYAKDPRHLVLLKGFRYGLSMRIKFLLFTKILFPV